MKSLKIIILIIICCVFTNGYSHTRDLKPLIVLNNQEGEIISATELDTYSASRVNPFSQLQPFEKGQCLPMTEVPVAITLDKTDMRKFGSNISIDNTKSPGIIIGEQKAGWETIMTEDMEGEFPGIWDVFTTSSSFDAYWGQESYRYYEGSYSAYCVGAGSEAVTPPGHYDNYTASWMVYGPFDLSGANDAYVDYQLWLNSESGYDYLYCLASLNGSNFYGIRYSGNSGGWTSKTFDLTDVYTLGDVTGEPEVYLAFYFNSDNIICSYEGAYIDDIELLKYVTGDGSPDIDIQPGSLTINEPEEKLGSQQELSEIARQAVPDPHSLIDEKYIVSREPDPLNPGNEIVGIIVPGRPPENYRAPVAVPNKSAITLSNVPAFTWVFGCSATSAAMIAGYYDNTGFPDMYTGPTNGGVMPMDNSVWGTEVINGETRAHCPLSATSEGIDGRATRGHVEDYWVMVDHSGPDPFITNGWTEHTWEDCTADFMGTNQSNWNNSDGGTMFSTYNNGAPLYDYTGGESSGNKDGCHGFRQFIESRGYTVNSNYSQLIYGYDGNTLGFTYDQYKAEIDAGRPVIIQVDGHSMVGYGYDNASSTIYIHDTWDYSNHTMTWGGTYSIYNLQHYGVAVFEIEGGDPPSPDCFTISNVGEGTLTVSSVSDDKDWLTIEGLPATPFCISVDNEQSMCVTVDWDLVPGASDMATITVISDDPDESSYNVTVTANKSGVPPDAPTLISPANGVTDQSTSLTLSWNDPGNTDSYSLQVDDDSDFSSPYYDQSELTSTSQSVTGLDVSTMYYWRVNATNSSGTSSWSSTWNFTTSTSVTDPDIDIQPDTLTIDESTKQMELSEIARQAVPDPHSLIDEKYIVSREPDPLNPGNEIVGIIVPGRPPENYRAPVAVPNKSAITLSNVPAFTWVFGCSATSAAMIAGYYDNTGFPDMYTGPTNGGVMPMDNSVWGTEVINGETRAHCPLSATSEGIDGRATRGHVEDYWVMVDHSGPDPFITNGWTEHTWEDCTADFMGTNQSNWNNSDGGTMFSTYNNGAPLYDYTGGESSGNKDGCHGFRQFIESRGYTVNSNYSQLIYGYDGNTLGFTYDQYKAEIDAGRPVIIQVDGHSMVGYGYDNASSTIYIHDTWDYSNHTMTWGGTYSIYNLQHYGVAVFEIEGGDPPASDCFTIYNVGSSDLTISSVSDDKEWLTVDESVPFSITAGNDHDMCVTVNWSLVTELSDTATITVLSDDPDESSYEVYVIANKALLPPDAPTLLGPAHLTTCHPTSITFSWNDPGNVDTYCLQVDDDSDFSSPFLDNSNILTTSHSVSDFNNETTFHWRVSATNTAGTSAWSSSWHFTTMPVTPGTPTLSSPPNGSVEQPDPILLIWNVIAGADSYQLQVDNNNDFGSPEVDQSSITSNASEVASLDQGTVFYWRVKAFNSCGAETSWSEVWNFATIGYVNYLTDVPFNGYSLEQNYPNPFSHTTSIDFVIPFADDVIFEIVDINGRIISINKNYYQAGQNTITLEFNDQLNNGVYFYRMKASDYIRTKVLLIE